MLALDEHILEVAARQNADLASIRQRVDGGVDRRVFPHTVHAIADRNSYCYSNGNSYCYTNSHSGERTGGDAQSTTWVDI